MCLIDKIISVSDKSHQIPGFGAVIFHNGRITEFNTGLNDNGNHSVPCAFETALKFDEDDLEARRSLAAVRIGARDAARGGSTS